MRAGHWTRWFSAFAPLRSLVTPDDLLRFAEACSHAPLLFGLDELAEIAERRARAE